MSFENPNSNSSVSQPSSAAAAALPSDVANMVQSNNTLITSMQANFDRKIQFLAQQVKRAGKGGGKQGKRGKQDKGKKTQENGNGNGNATGNGNGKQKGGGNGAKRTVSTGRQPFNRRAKRGRCQQ